MKKEKSKNCIFLSSLFSLLFSFVLLFHPHTSADSGNRHRAAAFGFILSAHGAVCL